MRKFVILAAFLSLALLAGCGESSPGADGPDPCGTSEDIRNAAALEAASPFGDDWQANGTLAEYENGYISMRLTLPEGWDWQEDPAEDGTEGILFWDGEKPDQRFRLSAWPDGFGMCGTGVDFSEVTLASGAQLTEAREEDRWIILIFDGVPGSYTVRPQGGTLNSTVWDAKWREQILTILDTAELGGDAMTEDEAIAKAAEVFSGDYDAAYGSYDLKTGVWTVRFFAGEQETGRVTVDAEGNAVVGNGENG
mgnify:FL=1